MFESPYRYSGKPRIRGVFVVLGPLSALVPTCQKTLHGVAAPTRLTELTLAVVRAEAI